MMQMLTQPWYVRLKRPPALSADFTTSIGMALHNQHRHSRMARLWHRNGQYHPGISLIMNYILTR